MGRDITTAVRELCLWFPETEERPSRGSPDFRVRGKTFATYAVNHHGDGRVALWLRSPPGAQQLHVAHEPQFYFVPAYVGPRGWLGVELDKGLNWQAVAERVREAYEHTAPAGLASLAPTAKEAPPPTDAIDAEEFDPLRQPRAQAILADLRAFCLGLPETSEANTFGTPTFKAGAKPFCGAHRRQRRLSLEFRVGGDRQAALTFDGRYSIPRYTGHQGWVSLDAEDDINWEEVRELALESYRRVALKRMLKALDGMG